MRETSKHLNFLKVGGVYTHSVLVVLEHVISLFLMPKSAAYTGTGFTPANPALAAPPLTPIPELLHVLWKEMQHKQTLSCHSIQHLFTLTVVR